MIIGGSKKAVIKNIKKLAEKGDFNSKAELGDPAFSPAESEAALAKFYDLRRHRLRHFFRRAGAYTMVHFATRELTKDLEIIGLDKIQHLKFPHGAFITSNHFNPVDATIPMKLAKKLRRPLFVVSQETNLALPAPLDFITNNIDLIPLPASVNATIKTFKPHLARVLEPGGLVLIYPEQEMWFNYRKPRPGRRGAYQFAAEFKTPIISCFTEMIDLPTADNDEFYKLRYRLHILGVLRPDPALSPRENSFRLAEEDYNLRAKAYEQIYGKKLDYKFDKSDIAGWRG